MRRVAAAFAVLAALGTLALLHAQSPVVIHGRVLSAEGGGPLVHARIVIYNDATPLPPIFSDGQGHFSTAPPPKGLYRLNATKAGYATTGVARLSNNPSDSIDVSMPQSAAISG